MDEKLLNLEIKDICEIGDYIIQIAKDNPITLICLGVGILLDRMYKDYKEGK